MSMRKLSEDKFIRLWEPGEAKTQLELFPDLERCNVCEGTGSTEERHSMAIGIIEHIKCYVCGGTGIKLFLFEQE